MAMIATATCDAPDCTRTRDVQRERPPTWWSLEDQGRQMRTGPLDFCSLACLGRWLAHPEVRRIYAADWER